MSKVKIGIALAAYKPDLATFAAQLSSIQKQTYENWVCIITFDSELEKVRSSSDIKAFLDDPRFIVTENPTRLGHKKNFERCTGYALEHGIDVLCFSDQDDIWYPNKLSRSLEIYTSLPPWSLVHSDMDILNAKGDQVADKSGWELERRIVLNAAPEHLAIRNVVAGCSIMMDAALARRFPTIPESFSYHDHWYATIAACLGTVYPLGERLYAYRQHAQNVAGITAYAGLFKMRRPFTRHTFTELTEKHQATRARARQIKEVLNYPCRPIWNWAFFARFDFGACYVFCGLSLLLKGDYALARACFARAIGKLLGSRLGLTD